VDELRKFLIESVSKIDEQAHITGIALIPRISRNNNAYTKGELKRFDNVTVPLNWEHDSQKQIGTVMFHYNPTLETVYYDGYVTDEAYANLVRNKTLFTSIEATPISSKTVCNGPDDCFQMPFGLLPEALALTETPGIPETSLNVIEHIIKEAYHQEECPEGQHMVDGKCVTKEASDKGDCIKKMMDHGKDHDQAVAICMKDEESYDELKKELEAIKKILTCPKCNGIKSK